MKKIYEMSREEMLEMLAKVIEKNPILEEKRNKINEEIMKKLEILVSQCMANLIRNVDNKDFNVFKSMDDFVDEYKSILEQTNIYTNEELELCLFVLQSAIYSTVQQSRKDDTQ